jgi:hypothetical protein
VDLPWILKTPAHLGGLQALAATFPGATVVHTHRDLTVVMPSACRLIEIARRMMSDDVDLVALGNEVLGVWGDEMARYISLRERLGNHLRVVDVSYAELMKDPIAVIREVYRRHDRELTPEAEHNMLNWERENPQHRFGRMSYSLDQYGLTRERIEDTFASYLERFGAIAS